MQRPATGDGSLTLFFSNGALGNGIKWDTCQQALSISITISFIAACTFDMVVLERPCLNTWNPSGFLASKIDSETQVKGVEKSRPATPKQIAQMWRAFGF